MAVTIKGFASDWSVPEPAKAGLGEVAAAAVAENVVTYPVRTGEVGVTSKRYPYGDVRRYGAVADANYYSTTDSQIYTSSSRATVATDNTVAFQRAADSVIALGGGALIVPAGNFLVDGTVKIRTAAPFVIRGEGMAPMLGAAVPAYRFSGIMRSTAGSVFQVNVTDTGGVHHFQSTLQVSDVTFFNGNPGVHAVAFEWVAVRAIFRNVSAFQFGYLVFENAVTGSSAGNEPYSDQSLFENIRMVYSTLGGIKLYRADASAFRNIYFEYPNPGALHCLWLIGASGVTIENVLYSDGRDVVTDKLADFWTGLVMLHNVSGATVRNIHTERIKLGKIVMIYTSTNVIVQNIQARFWWNRVVHIEGSKAVTINGVDMLGRRFTTSATTVHFAGAVSSFVDISNMRGADYSGRTNDGVTYTNPTLSIPSTGGLIQANVWYDGAAWQVKALTGADMATLISAAWDTTNNDGLVLTFNYSNAAGIPPQQFIVTPRPPAAGKAHEVIPSYISAQTAKLRFWDPAGVRVNAPDAQMSASVMMKLN